jgi:hypothetical protein
MELNSTSLRRYPRLWIFSLIFGAILYYFLIREAFVPKVITPGQQTFILVYSLLLSGVSAICVTRTLPGSGPPQWLDSRWKQRLAGIGAALALTGLLAVLPLPKFYSNVLQHTVVFLVIPFFIGERSRIAHWLEDRPNPPTVASNPVQGTERDVILHLSRRKAVFVLSGSALFVAGGWLMRLEAPLVAWACMVFFGLGMVAGLLLLIPDFSYLKIQRDGLTMRHSWREYTFLWDEISDLTIVTGPRGPRVAFNFNRPGARRSAILREMYDRDMVLIDNYGLSAQEMCGLLQSRKAASAART